MADFTRRITGSDAVSSVMRSMGLTPPPLIVGSSDENAAQLWELATDVGQQLCDVHPWQWLLRDHTITTVPAQTLYPLPDAFNGYISDAQWNQTSQLPMIGSLTEPEWQMLKARQIAGSTFTLLFRVVNDNLEIYDPPSAPQTLVLPYRSRGWVESVTGVAKDNLSENDDVVMLDPQLFKAALKLAFHSAKAFDTSDAAAVTQRCLAAAKAKDSPSRTLALAGSRGYPLLGSLNIPDQGYGS